MPTENDDPVHPPAQEGCDSRENRGWEDVPVTIRIKLTDPLRKLIHAASERLDATPKWTLEHLLRTVVDRIEDRSLDLGYGFKPVVDVPPPQERANPRKYPLRATGSLDTSKLQTNPKIRSGYTGVYQNGSGFSARGPNGTYIGNYRTAAEAALARMQYYEEHGLPYGDLAERVVQMLKEDDTIQRMNITNPEVVRRIAIYEARQFGTPFEGLSPEDRRWETVEPWEKITSGAWPLAAPDAEG